MDTSEFTDEQIEALQALADGYNDQSVSRRDVMKLAGAGGVGALLGSGGAMSAVEQASAGTAQSGQLGTVGDPLDLVTEDLMDPSGNVVASANAGALEGTDLRYESVNTKDTATDPSANGEFRRNGADVKVYSGGGVRNLTNIGTAGGDVSVSDDGIQVVPAAADLNFTGISVTDDGDSTVTIGGTIDMGNL